MTRLHPLPSRVDPCKRLQRLVAHFFPSFVGPARCLTTHVTIFGPHVETEQFEQEFLGPQIQLMKCVVKNIQALSGLLASPANTGRVDTTHHRKPKSQS